MAKQKEIKFRDRGYVLEGRRGNLTFAIYNDNTKEVLEEQTYYVVVRHKEIESLGFNTAGYPPALQRRLHPALGQFRAIPQALVRQAGPVLPPGHFLVNHMDRHARGFGNFFRRPPILPQFFNFLAVGERPMARINANTRDTARFIGSPFLCMKDLGALWACLHFSDKAAEYYEQQGYRVVGAINGDFYDTSSGYPLGMLISNGQLLSGSGNYYAVGFRRKPPPPAASSVRRWRAGPPPRCRGL